MEAVKKHEKLSGRKRQLTAVWLRRLNLRLKIVDLLQHGSYNAQTMIRRFKAKPRPPLGFCTTSAIRFTKTAR